MVWIILGFIVLAYVVADGFFEVSAKLSGWWKLRARPVLRRVWGAVAGRSPVVAIKANTEAAPAAPVPSSLEDSSPASVRPVLNTGQVPAFLWKAKWLILIVAAWLLIVGSIEGWFGKSRGHLRLEAEIAEANARVAQHEARLGELSRDLAVNTERDRARRSRVLAQAEQELNHAADKIDPDALYDAYASGYRCLLTDDCGDDGANPPPPGTAPMRGAFGSAV